MKLFFSIITILLFNFSVTMVSFAQSNLNHFYISGFAQGTTYHITFYAKDSTITKGNIDSIFDKIDSSLSIYKPYSLISQFNIAASGVEMDEHFRVVVQKSLDIFKETGGISDITVYPIVKAWGFGPEPVSGLPDSAAIRAMLRCVGSQKIHISGNRLVKDTPCIKLDLNGIAQGYSVDVIAGFLGKRGIENYLVEVGGELCVKGRRQPGGEFMRVGIEAPAKDSSDEPIVKKIMTIDHGAVTTSGNYRKYYQSGNKRISHIMDPRTGYPVQNELISVTIWAKDGITADGYDNALMGMGLKKALLFMERHKEMEAYFIYHKANGSISDTATKGFYKFFVKGIRGKAQD